MKAANEEVRLEVVQHSENSRHTNVGGVGAGVGDEVGSLERNLVRERLVAGSAVMWL